MTTRLSKGALLKGTGFVGALVRVVKVEEARVLVELRGGKQKWLSMKTLLDSYRPATKREARERK